MIQSRWSKDLLSDSAIYLFANIVNAAIPFALMPVLTRYLAPNEYGVVAMFQTLIAGLGAVVGLSVAGAAARKFYDTNLSEKDLRAFIGACLQILVASSLIVLVVVVLCRQWLTNHLGLEARWLIGAVLTTAMSVVIQIRLGQWQVRRRARTYAALQIGWSALNMALSLLFVVALLKGANGRMAGHLGAVAIVAVIAIALLMRDNLLSLFSWHPEHLKEATRFGLPLVPHVAGIFLIGSIDRVAIASELGISKAGIYMVAAQLALALGLLFDAFNSAYAPWLYEKLKRDRLDEKRQIVLYTYGGFAAILSLVAIFFAAGPELVRIVAGDRYKEAAGIVGWIALGHGFVGMYLLITNYIFYSKRTGLLALATISTGVVNVLLLFFLIRMLGMKGAAIAFACSMGLRFLLCWYVAQRTHPMPWVSAVSYRFGKQS